ncbi:MAG: hypothetical protein IJX49_01475 [Clostridia bacterium]|nr:hypothetical protein [Clostridia bacterium]
MLDYTKAAIKQIAQDFKKVDLVRNVLTQLLYIFYLGYAIFARSGIFTVNLILFVLSVGYFAFFIWATGQENSNKKMQKVVKLVYTRCKQLVKLFTLGVMLYGVWIAAENVTPLGMILSALMIVGWVLQIVFEIIIKFFSKRINLLIEGLEADYEGMTKPARSVGNFFKKVAGKEVQEKEVSEARLFLEQKVSEKHAERKNEKLESKYVKKRDKKNAKNRKKATKKAVKDAKKEAKAEKRATKNTPTEKTE